MGFSAPKFFTIFVLLCLALLFFTTQEVQADICKRRSRTWKGPCLDNKSCRDQCVNVEHENAIFGGCHQDGFGFACFSSSMASFAPKFSTIFVFSLLLFFIWEVQAGEPCQCRSKTWFGPCFDSNGCKNQCINQEQANFGACHRQGIGTACFCYYTCGTQPC
ncbi:uncharacterized protein LOC113850745 [Abrus precatorius]|uniref:Uncharacterized protein LOC113850745 n=1 Tax=Abrus precatorius TaxID=3816 RepID=A0A8B8K050_ABRPR|nr:uncharacterized protein LOC113850745 [Abrus precatorius]